METVLLARHAMATRFELVLHGTDPRGLRAAGEEALDEIERIEGRLSPYQPTSEIADVNARASREPVRVSPEVFALLERASHLNRATDGAFDITVGPLMRCWGLQGRIQVAESRVQSNVKGQMQIAGPLSGRVPDAEDLAEARRCVGMGLVHLDSDNMTIGFERPGVTLDLGALGKGYAIDRAVELLREAGVTSAFIHGGTSTVYGLGLTPNGTPWQVAVDWPPRPFESAAKMQNAKCKMQNDAKSDDEEKAKDRATLATIPLRDEALSVSAPSGKSFRAGGETYGHVIDPRSGMPVTGAALAAVAMSGATETDALSTALLTLGISGRRQIAECKMQNAKCRTLVAEWQDAQLRVSAQGIIVADSPGLLLVD
jgi:thiamine biosynthesis lipoprotein